MKYFKILISIFFFVIFIATADGHLETTAFRQSAYALVASLLFFNGFLDDIQKKKE